MRGGWVRNPTGRMCVGGTEREEMWMGCAQHEMTDSQPCEMGLRQKETLSCPLKVCFVRKEPGKRKKNGWEK